MENIGNILRPSRLTEPPEVAIIKQFVDNKYHRPVHVLIQPKQITIIAPGAALAGSLRMDLTELQKLCQTNKRLTIRISQ